VFWYSLSRCMCVTWSWRTCILALGFALKSRCDTKHFKSKSSVVRRYNSFPSRINLSAYRRTFLSLILLGCYKYLTRGVLQSPNSSLTILEETAPKQGCPPRGGLTGPRGWFDRGTRFDRPVEAIEPGLPEHNPRLHQTSGFILENFFFWTL
jgi:hypothetical protein